MSEISILVVEDEPMIAEDIASALEQVSFQVSGIAYTAEDALRQMAERTPDLALLDINLGRGTDGISLAEIIRTTYGIPFLFLTSYADRDTVNRAKTAAPAGYIVKPFTEASLYTSIEIAWYNFRQQQAARHPQLDMSKINRNLPGNLALTEREFEVLRLIYEGKTNQQIAAEIFVSANTVKKHINNAYLKLDTGTRTSAIARLRDLNH